MDWMILLVIGAIIVTAVSLWKMYRIKRKAELFADKVEKALDDIISGKEMDNSSVTEDTLWGKVSEKMQRVEHIWTKKEEEGRRNKEKMKELVSDISHQTKTPIANMKIYLELLEDEEISTKGREFVFNLKKQTDKLEFLFQSMIKMSRLETGVIQIKKEYANLYDTLAKAVETVVPKMSKKGISLYVEKQDDLRLYHDRKWTEEALFNVLDNAVKYTDQGGEIYVSITKQEIFTKISIKDTGKGIAVSRQAQIFTRFYREPEVHEQEGIGVGLYLSRKILELQGGYIEVCSEAGEGAEFYLYLPNDHTFVTI